MIDWDQWQTLLAVFRNQTYFQAAQSLGINATTVGRRVKFLEKRLGYKLFLRDDGHLFPTNQCAELLTHIESASELLRLAEQQSVHFEKGEIWRNLRLTAPPFLINNLYAPNLQNLNQALSIRVELLASASFLSLSRREADIAIRLDDHPPTNSNNEAQIAAIKIGIVGYAVFCHVNAKPQTLPWAGLTEEHVRTTGSETMTKLAGSSGFQFRTNHFDGLKELAANGMARALLPCFIANKDSRLQRISTTRLQQPLWMLYHRQDEDVPHLCAAREWITKLGQTELAR